MHSTVVENVGLVVSEQNTPAEQDEFNTRISNAISTAQRSCGLSTRSTSEARFHTIDDTSLNLIESRMAEVDRASRSLGRSQTGTMDKLMSLTMMSESPFRAMRQCLAKIESRRGALKENVFGLRKKDIELRKKYLELKNPFFGKEGDLDRSLIEIEIEQLQDGIKDSLLYIEGALKEIGVYQDAYEQIRVNHNIRENWDETDAEVAEVAHHIRMAFLHSFRDVMAHGRIGMGTMEYLHQFGISPLVVLPLVSDFMQSHQVIDVPQIKDLKYDGYEHLTGFLDAMAEQFKDSHKKSMVRVGLDPDKLISTDFVYKES